MEQVKEKKTRIFKCLIGFLAGLLIGLFISSYLLGFYRVSGVSMEPTYVDGDLVCVNKLKSPKVGDVVVVKVQDRLLIKRILRLETYSCYLMGDNRDNSWDSRYFGEIPTKGIVGVVIS